MIGLLLVLLGGRALDELVIAEPGPTRLEAQLRELTRRKS